MATSEMTGQRLFYFARSWQYLQGNYGISFKLRELMTGLREKRKHVPYHRWSHVHNLSSSKLLLFADSHDSKIIMSSLLDFLSLYFNS